jgi:hypothetical protein
MSKEPKAARAKSAPQSPPPEPVADPAILLGAAGVRADGPPPKVSIARCDGADVIDLTAQREHRRLLEELFNVALGREPDSSRSLIDQTSATPKVIKVREAAQHMEEQLGARGFEIVRRF